jgi:hypothetical protein
MKIRRTGVWMGCAVALATAGCEGARLEAAVGGGRDVTDTTDDDVAANDTSDTSDDASNDVTADTVEDTTTDVGPDVVTPVAEWEALPLGDLGAIDGLAVRGADEAWATSGPRALRFNGVTWAAFGAPDPERNLHGIWSDGTTVIAVGDGGLIARRAAGAEGRWVTETSGVTVALWAIAGRSADDLVVAGDDGVVLRFDGETWEKRHERATLRLRAVDIAPETTGDDGIRAVGSNGQLVERVGDTWRATQIAASASVLSGFGHMVDGTRIAVGTRHTLTALRPNAAAWQGETTNDSRQRDVAALTVGQDGVVRAFGAEGLVLRRDGLAWSIDTAAGNVAGVRNFGSVGGFGTGESAGLIALARDGGGVQLRNGTWSALPTALDATVTDIAADTTGRMWLSATRGILMVNDGNDWSVLPLPFQTDLHALAPDAAGGMWVVGAGGRILHVTESLQIETIPVPVPVDLFGVATSGTRVFACGRGGTLLSVDTTPEIPIVDVRATSTVADLRAVAVVDGTIWVGGAFGTLLKAPVAAGAFTQVATSTGGSIHAIEGFGASIHAAGDNGIVLRVNGDVVTLEHEAPGIFLYGLALGDDGALAVGSGGTILRRTDDGGEVRWVAEVPATPAATFEAVHIDADGAAWVGSNRREASLERRLAPLGTGETP